MALEGRPVQRCILAPVQIQLLQASTQSSSRHAMPSSHIQKPVTTELDHTCWTMKPAGDTGRRTCGHGLVLVTVW